MLMRIPVWFMQCGSVQEARLAARTLENDHIPGMDILCWEEYQLVGIRGSMAHTCHPGRFQAKVCFYDGHEKDYELGAWNDAIRLFHQIKSTVCGMPSVQVAAEYFAHYGIMDADAALNERTDGYGWPIPVFFTSRGITSFECMYDCENHMRKVVVSERIFDALDADNMIFGGNAVWQ